MQENNLIHQAFPVSDGDDSIRQDVLSQAVSLRSRHQHQTRTKRTVVGSIATLFVVGSALTIGPAAYAYYRIQAISNSVSDCKSAIMQSYDIGPDGRAKPSGTITFANGNWRIEGLGRTQVYTKSTLWSYDPKNQRVTKRFKPDGPFGYNPSGFSIGAMIADFDRFKWGTNAQLGSATIEGRPAETLTIDVPIQSRGIVYADPNTHMPFRMEIESKANGKWKVSGFSTFRFNEPVRTEQFATTFPKGTKIVNVDNIKSDWAKKLENVMFTLKSPTRTIEVRDMFVNERGHIFVIFTDGYTIAEFDKYVQSMRNHEKITTYHKQAEFKVTDDQGAVYFQSENFTPYTNGIGGQPSPSVHLSNNQYLNGAWLVPAKPVAWRPKTLTISCIIPLEFKVGDTYKEGEKTSSISIPITKPDGPLLPDWIEACAMAPHADSDVIKEEYKVHLVPEMILVNPKSGRATSNIIKYKYGR